MIFLVLTSNGGFIWCLNSIAVQPVVYSLRNHYLQVKSVKQSSVLTISIFPNGISPLLAILSSTKSGSMKNQYVLRVPIFHGGLLDF